jgi:hypothetical protein
MDRCSAFNEPRGTLGILASDAIVIAADTQVGIDDSTALKLAKGKFTTQVT